MAGKLKLRRGEDLSETDTESGAKEALIAEAGFAENTHGLAADLKAEQGEVAAEAYRNAVPGHVEPDSDGSLGVGAEMGRLVPVELDRRQHADAIGGKDTLVHADWILGICNDAADTEEVAQMVKILETDIAGAGCGDIHVSGEGFAQKAA
mgnify:CR=1 FL=1